MKFLAELRDLGWTAARFSRELEGVSPHTFKRIEQGKRVHPAILDLVKRKLEEIRLNSLKAS